MDAGPNQTVSLRGILAQLQWTAHSWFLMSGLILVIGLIIIVWLPLAQEALAFIDWGGEWWLTIDWMLIEIFLVMSFLIMARADLRFDARIIFVGLLGGLVIESWGTQTQLWTYYTEERPPLWILPAWSIASLAIDRLTRLLNALVPPGWVYPARQRACSASVRLVYALVFGGFYGLMLSFVLPTLDKPFTWMALGLCALLILTPTDHRWAILTFLAGAGLGYYLELWGTTRECWTYYTRQTPPLFAVLAHGMAAVAFWRAQLVVEKVFRAQVQRLKAFQA